MLGNEAFDPEEINRAYQETTIRRMADYGGTSLAVMEQHSRTGGGNEPFTVKRPHMLNPVKTPPQSIEVKEEHPPTGKAPVVCL
jgi:hypothetical protein